MTESNRSSTSPSALLPLLCLALGLVGGFGIARLMAPTEVASKLGRSEPGQHALSPTETVALTLEPVTTLEAQANEPARERVAVSTPSRTLSGGQAPALPHEIAPELRSELTAFLRSGRFEAQMEKDREDVQEFLAYEYSRAGDAERALALLEKFPAVDPDVYLTVGARLQRAENVEAAGRAYSLAFELDPRDEEILEDWGKFDPSGALAAVEARAAALGAEASPILELQRAQLLSALGRTDEAVVLAQNLIGFNNRDPWALELLAELDPAGAERDLRSRLASDPSGVVAVNLAERLIDSEQSEEAVQLLEGALEKSPENSNALSLLASLRPDKVLTYLDSPAANELDSESLSHAAGLLLESGKEVEAVDLWVRAVGQDLSDEDAIEGLLQYAPERLWEKCRQIERESTNDETLGDVADVYWSQGRQEEATVLWRRASIIDPSDSEWSSNLRAILLGEDPL